MNKKGFTLMELLAVIIILALLALVANSSVTNVVKNSKSDLYTTQIELIKTAAETWGSENIDKIPADGMCSYLTLKDLKEYGLFEDKIINPKTEKEFKNDLKIKLTSKVTESGLLKTTYEVDPISIKNCNKIYTSLCTLLVDSDFSSNISRGDKYSCKVKENLPEGYENGYTFYVLNNNDKTIDLILEGNICDNGLIADSNNLCKVSWGANTLTGPVEALNYLYNATKDWYSVPNIEFNYDDHRYGYIQTEKDRTSIYSSNLESAATYVNLKARLPYESEIGSEAFLTSNLYDNLNGYWLANTSPDDAENAMFKTNTEGLVYKSIVDATVGGIRPVITINSTDIE